MQKLKPCPFCGGEADFLRLGSRRQSSQVACTDCGAWVEGNEEGDFNGDKWNRRFVPKKDEETS